MSVPTFLSLPTEISPNADGLPGIVALERIVGGLLTLGLVAAVAGVALSAIAWAIGSHSSNPHVAGRGKTGVLVSVAAAMLIGAANALVAFFNTAGRCGPMKASFTGRAGPRRATRAAATALGVLATVVAVLLIRPATDDASTQPEPTTPTNTAPPSEAATKPSVTAAADPAAYQLERLRAMVPVTPAPGSAKISGESTKQPDLYAAEYVRRLLTQDFGLSRQAHLSWVQGESATTTEPLVVGLVPPELRDRLAVWSVSDDAFGPTAVPSLTEWAALASQQAHTTAVIERVLEPLPWVQAVAAGQMSDPGLTAREVTAAVTRHTTINGRATQAGQRHDQPGRTTDPAAVGVRRPDPLPVDHGGLTCPARGSPGSTRRACR